MREIFKIDKISITLATILNFKTNEYFPISFFTLQFPRDNVSDHVGIFISVFPERR